MSVQSIGFSESGYQVFLRNAVVAAGVTTVTNLGFTAFCAAASFWPPWSRHSLSSSISKIIAPARYVALIQLAIPATVCVIEGLVAGDINIIARQYLFGQNLNFTKIGSAFVEMSKKTLKVYRGKLGNLCINTEIIKVLNANRAAVLDGQLAGVLMGAVAGAITNSYPALLLTAGVVAGYIAGVRALARQNSH